jgi:hypothetical protein
MAYLNPRVLDSGLSVLDTEATHLYLCTQEPATYTQATDDYALASKSGISIGAPEDRSGGGRKVVVAAFTGGTVADGGDATHWAIVDSVNSRLLATKALASPQTLYTGNSFNFDAADIGIPGAV